MGNERPNGHPQASPSSCHSATWLKLRTSPPSSVTCLRDSSPPAWAQSSTNSVLRSPRSRTRPSSPSPSRSSTTSSSCATRFQRRRNVRLLREHGAVQLDRPGAERRGPAGVTGRGQRHRRPLRVPCARRPRCAERASSAPRKRGWGPLAKAGTPSFRWRRRRDLNPRWGLPQTALAVRRHRPD